MYDAGTRPQHYLREYAREFASVEIDSTFYGTPSPERVRAWTSAVPAGFTFSCKWPREITHERRLCDVRGLVAEFYDAMRGFGDRFGCALAQFEASFGRAEELALNAVLDVIPAGVPTAFEFRDPAWYCDSIQARLEARGHALALADAPFVADEVLAAALERSRVDFAYVRLVGRHDEFDRFDRVRAPRAESLERWARRLRSRPNLRRVFAYANNHYEGHSPATIRAFAAALGVDRPVPARVRQPSLFGDAGSA